jgi:hypothetical protein
MAGSKDSNEPTRSGRSPISCRISGLKCTADIDRLGAQIEEFSTADIRDSGERRYRINERLQLSKLELAFTSKT